LFVLNACSEEEAADRGEAPGGTFDVSEEATTDVSTALEDLGGEEFIFDVQTHYVNQDLSQPGGEWTSVFPGASCEAGGDEDDPRVCFTAEAYFRELFVRSDTSMAILSALPAQNLEGLQPEDMVFAIDAATRIGCEGRVFMHGGAYPHHGPIEAALASMADLREQYDIAAWKIYTMTPTDAYFYFDDHDPDRPQIGQRFIDQVRELGPNIICTHKGIASIVGSSYELASPSDIGPAAARNPDINFVVYHSGFEPGQGGTGPYDPENPTPEGVDRLIRSMQDAGVEPNTNVYAELGGTWWFVMRDPTVAAHVLGKLLLYVGEDRVVWGTDSIWFGTPQDQIQAMRSFQISEELQERHGYPALTDETKAKIFGLTSANLYGIEPITGTCELSAEEVEAVRASLPPARTYGPRTYAEAHRMINAHMTGLHV
jgi:predicted TIM-barrel fold metal-dependent hydrolase